MKKTLLMTALGLVLVFGLAANSPAALWSSGMTGSTYAWVGKSDPAHASTTWSEGSALVPAGGFPSLLFNMDLTVSGSWDDPADSKNTNPKVWDAFRLQIWNGASLVYEGSYAYDNSKPTDVSAHSIQLLLPYVAGVYSFKAWGDVTARDETWTLNSASLSASTAPTPLPDGLWLLGGGLAALMGLRRMRKN